MGPLPFQLSLKLLEMLAALNNNLAEREKAMEANTPVDLETWKQAGKAGGPRGTDEAAMPPGSSASSPSSSASPRSKSAGRTGE